MPLIELTLPRMGESIEEATILNWTKSVGDRIEADETMLEVATDKVDSEVPSPVSGVIAKLLFNEGEVVRIGSVLAYIESDDEVEGLIDFPTIANLISESTKDNINFSPAGIDIKLAGATAQHFEKSDNFYSPLVRSIALQENISIEELDKIKGTGKDGRVTKSDLLSYLSSKRYGSTASDHKKSETIDLKLYEKSRIFISPDDEIEEMDRMRKLISEHMIMSKRISPHVSSTVEADVTNIVEWRNKIKLQFQEEYNEKLTFTPIFFEAISKAIQDFPLINVQVDGDKIIKKKHINLGMATALPSGNLIVPVIKDADQMNILELSKKVNDLAIRARENKLKPQPGTMTG